MNDFTEQFLVEAREQAEQASADLLRLEEQPDDKDVLERVFRAFHTLKGAAGIMEYRAMETLLHRAEDALQDVRAGRRSITPALVDALLASIGQLMRWFSAIEETGDMPDGAAADADKVSAGLTSTEARLPPLVAPWDEDFLVWARGKDGAALKTGRAAVRYRPAVDCFFRGHDPFAVIADIPGLLAVRLTPATPWPAPADLQTFDCNLVIEALSTASRETLIAALKPDGELDMVELAAGGGGDLTSAARAILEEQVRFLRLEAPTDSLSGRTASAARTAANVLSSLGRPTSAINSAASVDALIAVLDRELSASAPEGPSPIRDAITTIRVEVGKIDAIVDLTGELMIAKNALGHLAGLAAEGGDISAIAGRLRSQHDTLERHIADLQRAVFDLRVLPLERVFSRFPRLARETAGALGKQVNFSASGEDTKADKAIVEALFEPLLHIIRNAIDHGIETPQARAAAGKPPAASLSLSARREGDHVILDVSDDGQGMDPSRIRMIAANRRIADATDIAAMSDEEALGLVFAPGFSTADKVSGLSGRGVGMGAVRAAIEKLGGEVRLLNQKGKGLTVRLILPFTIMLTRVMTVQAGGQTFGVPFDAILETIRIQRDVIRPLGSGRAFVLRDQTLPVIDLAQSLGLPAANPAGQASILVIETRSGRAGLEIDRPGERMDLMLKPVTGLLSGMPAVAGASLLGTGDVLVVLDLEALLQ